MAVGIVSSGQYCEFALQPINRGLYDLCHAGDRQHFVEQLIERRHHGTGQSRECLPLSIGHLPNHSGHFVDLSGGVRQFRERRLR